MRDIFGMRADASENPEDRLHEQGRLDQTAVQEMLEIIKVPDVVAFELEARAVIGAGRQNEFDVLERIPEHQIARILQMLALPLKLEFLVAIEQMEQPKIH